MSERVVSGDTFSRCDERSDALPRTPTQRVVASTIVAIRRSVRVAPLPCLARRPHHPVHNALHQLLRVHITHFPPRRSATQGRHARGNCPSATECPLLAAALAAAIAPGPLRVVPSIL